MNCDQYEMCHAFDVETNLKPINQIKHARNPFQYLCWKIDWICFVFAVFSLTLFVHHEATQFRYHEFKLRLSNCAPVPDDLLFCGNALV